MHEKYAFGKAVSDSLACYTLFMVFPAPPTIEADAARILATLPKWFGIPESTAAYARATREFPTLVTQTESATGSRVTGFLSLQQHFPSSVEIHCLAVEAESRGNGQGRELVAAAVAWSKQRGVGFLQVKTLADTHPDPQYAQTRAFYLANGFVPLEVFPELWGPDNPCLLMVRSL
jgi:GNAT superfamily N-acetyltransferase